jgi:hypothetical protein
MSPTPVEMSFFRSRVARSATRRAMPSRKNMSPKAMMLAC